MTETAEWTTDRVSHWCECNKVPEVIKRAGQRTMELAEAEVAEKGYRRHPEREPSVSAVDNHHDLFMNNKVVVIAEIPVLLTRKQWIERHLPAQEKMLQNYRQSLEVVKRAKDRAAMEWHAEKIEEQERLVQSYRDELEVLGE